MSILAFRNPVYQPAMRIIDNITNQDPAIVTTSFPHNYINGLIVRLIVPPGFGMIQANQLFGEIIVLSPTTFAINIDTTFFDDFDIPLTFPDSYQEAQCVPIGEDNSILTGATQNVLPYS